MQRKRGVRYRVDPLIEDVVVLRARQTYGALRAEPVR